jgi:hypothetical protein
MIRSGKSPPRTLTSSKRVLSSTSPNFPLPEGKKTKTFTSPNRFTVLALIDTNDDTVFDATPPACEVTVPSSLPSDQAEPAAPPIYIRDINKVPVPPNYSKSSQNQIFQFQKKYHIHKKLILLVPPH